MGEISEALRRARLEKAARADEAEHREDAAPRIRDRVAPARPAAAPRPPAAADEAPPAVPGSAAADEAPAAVPGPSVAADEAPAAVPGPSAPERPPAPIERLRTPLWPARAVLVEGQRAAAERFRQLAVAVEHALATRGGRTLLVTSSHRGEGKTLTACNLALAMASLGGERSVGLVDLDLRRPTVLRALGLQSDRGLEETLQGRLPSSEIRIRTDIPSLDVYAPARPVHNAHALLSSPTLDELIRDLSARHSVVIFDTPPALLVPDVALIASRVGSCLLVARAGSSRRNAALDALRLLPEDTLIGVFLNEARVGSRALRYYEEYYGPEEDEPADWEEPGR